METWVKVLRIMNAMTAILFFLNGDVGLGIIFVILAVTTTGKVDWHKTIKTKSPVTNCNKQKWLRGFNYLRWKGLFKKK